MRLIKKGVALCIKLQPNMIWDESLWEYNDETDDGISVSKVVKRKIILKMSDIIDIINVDHAEK